MSSCWQRDIATESQKHRKSQSLSAAAALMNTVALYKQIDMTIKQANVTINVKDMDAAVSFYQSLGFAVKNRWGNYYAQVTAPGITIGLHPANNGNLRGNSGNVSIGFTSDDLEETRSSLEKLSIAVAERSEEGGQFLNFTDPDGTALYFIKPKWG